MQEDKHRGSLSEKFEGFGAAPSDALWDSISDSLDGKKKRRGVIWLWFGTGLAAVLTLGIVTYTINTKSAPQNNIQLANQIEEPIVKRPFKLLENKAPKQMLSGDRGDVHLSEVNANTTLNVNESDVVNVNEKSIGEESFNEVENLVNQQSDSYVEEPSFIDEEFNPDEEDISYALLKNEIRKINTDLVYPNWSMKKIEANKGVRKGNWELGFGMMKYTPLNFDSKKATDEEDPAPKNEGPVVDLGDTVTSSLEEIDAEPQQQEPSIDVKQSIGARLHIGYQFGNRWRINSGVEYSRTIYTADNKVGSLQANTKVLGGERSVITSIAVPLTVSYDFVRGRRFNFSAEVGMLTSIPLHEKQFLKTNSFATAVPSQDLEYNASTGQFISGYEGAAHLSLGIGYDLAPQLRIQANPTMRMFFKQNVNNVTETDLPYKRNWAGGSLNLIWSL